MASRYLASIASPRPRSASSNSANKFALFLSRNVVSSMPSRRPRAFNSAALASLASPVVFVVVVSMSAYVPASGRATQAVKAKTPMASLERAVTRTRVRYAPEVSQRNLDIAFDASDGCARVGARMCDERRVPSEDAFRRSARRGVRDDAVDVDAIGASRVDEMYEIFYYTSHARPDEVPDPTNTRASQRR